MVLHTPPVTPLALCIFNTIIINKKWTEKDWITLRSWLSKQLCVVYKKFTIMPSPWHFVWTSYPTNRCRLTDFSCICFLLHIRKAIYRYFICSYWLLWAYSTDSSHSAESLLGAVCHDSVFQWLIVKLVFNSQQLQPTGTCLLSNQFPNPN